MEVRGWGVHAVAAANKLNSRVDLMVTGFMRSFLTRGGDPTHAHHPVTRVKVKSDLFAVVALFLVVAVALPPATSYVDVNDIVVLE